MDGNPNVQSVLEMQQQFETARKSAIEELLTVIADAKKGLVALGYVESPAKPKQTVKPALKKACPRCGAADHDARYHRGDAKEAGGAAA